MSRLSSFSISNNNPIFNTNVLKVLTAISESNSVYDLKNYNDTIGRPIPSGMSSHYIAHLLLGSIKEFELYNMFEYVTEYGTKIAAHNPSGLGDKCGNDTVQQGCYISGVFFFSRYVRGTQLLKDFLTLIKSPVLNNHVANSIPDARKCPDYDIMRSEICLIIQQEGQLSSIEIIHKLQQRSYIISFEEVLALIKSLRETNFIKRAQVYGERFPDMYILEKDLYCHTKDSLPITKEVITQHKLSFLDLSILQYVDNYRQENSGKQVSFAPWVLDSIITGKYDNCHINWRIKKLEELRLM